MNNYVNPYTAPFPFNISLPPPQMLSVCGYPYHQYGCTVYPYAQPIPHPITYPVNLESDKLIRDAVLKEPSDLEKLYNELYHLKVSLKDALDKVQELEDFCHTIMEI